MGRSVDSKRWAAWRARLRRLDRSGLPVTRFCDSEGVSAASVYRWRKRIAAADEGHAAGTAAPSEGQAFAAVTVVDVAALIAELPGGTRLRIPAGNVQVLRAAIEEIAVVDSRLGQGEQRC
jgi:hypothetical protein